MSRQYKRLTSRHARILCHKCETETALELQHFEVINDDEITEKITWACSACKDNTADYNAFSIREWNKVMENSLVLRSKLILRRNFDEIFPNGLEFQKNESFHTLLQRGNIEISKNRVIEPEERESCCICYTKFTKRNRTAVCTSLFSI
jgi:hypothetical protein